MYRIACALEGETTQSATGSAELAVRFRILIRLLFL
jgi:hypothetical protein